MLKTVLKMPPEISTAVQAELTTSSPMVGYKNELTKSPLEGDEKTPRISVIAKSENKKKPYGGRPLRFQCPNCERKFHAPSHLKRHMLCHTSERPFQCHICSKGFLQAWHLGRHMTTHTGNKPFNCPECPKTFGSRFEMKTHCNYIHRGIKEHECLICKKMFTLRSNLKVHMRKHTGEKPYECHVCFKKFGQRGHLQYHLRKHEGAEEETTKKKMSDIEKKDIDVENENDQSVTYDSGVESICSDNSHQSSPKSFREISAEKNNQVTTISQDVSSENTATEVPLSGRMFDHTNPQELKPFVCVSCSCGFGEINSLRAHVRHSHQRKGIETGHFSCAHCYQAFSEIDMLKVHYVQSHRPHTNVTSVISRHLSPQLQRRKIGEKSIHDDTYDLNYTPDFKRSYSQILNFPKARSPDNLSTISDTTHDRLPVAVYQTCSDDCECKFFTAPHLMLKQINEDEDYVQSRYLIYLEQYQKLLESHVKLIEALQISRK